MQQIQLLSINWEYSATSIRPARDACISVSRETICSLVTLMTTLNSISEDDDASIGLYTVVPAPLPNNNVVSDMDSVVPMFLVYPNEVWYMLEDKTTAYPRRAKQRITSKLLRFIV